MKIFPKEPSVSASGIRYGYNGGTFLEREYLEALEKGIPLTLDFSIPCACFNECTYCGYRDTQKGDVLGRDEIISVIHQFAALGGRSVKFVGEGEPLTRKDIFLLISEIRKDGMVPVVFSCGDLLGDDDLCIKIHGVDGGEAIGRLAEADVTVMLKYDSKNQDSITRRIGYSEKRDRALERLKNIGFNLHNPTHLGFGTVILRCNYKEIPEIFNYAIPNNVYPLNCPLMPIGRAEDDAKRAEIGITGDEMAELTIKLNIIAWEYGITFTQPADFPGGLKCDISRAGLFVAYTGRIDPCEAHLCDAIGNVRQVPLAVAWKNINELKEREYDGQRGLGLCFPKLIKGIIPPNYDQKVTEKVQAFIKRYPKRFNSRPRVVMTTMP
jgi:MoaA/NifB/PqqE/SkfB family radical SAM enzyme